MDTHGHSRRFAEIRGDSRRYTEIHRDAHPRPSFTVSERRRMTAWAAGQVRVISPYVTGVVFRNADPAQLPVLASLMSLPGW